MSALNKKYSAKLSISAIFLTAILIWAAASFLQFKEFKQKSDTAVKNKYELIGKNLNSMAILAQSATESSSEKLRNSLLSLRRAAFSSGAFAIAKPIEKSKEDAQSKESFKRVIISPAYTHTTDNIRSIVAVTPGTEFSIYSKSDKLGNLQMIYNSFDFQMSDMPLTSINTNSSAYKNSSLNKTILLGQTSFSLTAVRNELYLSALTNIIDENGSIVGAICAYRRAEDFADLKKLIMNFEEAVNVYLIDSASKVLVSRKVAGTWSADCINKVEGMIANIGSLDKGEMKEFAQSPVVGADSSNVAAAICIPEWNLIALTETSLDEIELYKKEHISSQLWLAAFALSIMIMLIIIYRNYSKKIDAGRLAKLTGHVDKLRVLSDNKMPQNTLVTDSVPNEKTPLEVSYDYYLYKIFKNIEDARKDRYQLINMYDDLKEQVTISLNKNEILFEIISSDIDKLGKKSEFIKTTINSFAKSLDSFSNEYETLIRECVATIQTGREPEQRTNGKAERPSILQIKFGIIRDKIIKILEESNAFKSVTDKIYILSVNSAILADKVGISKIGSFSTELNGVADRTIETIDQFRYLVSELQTAIDSCESDILNGENIEPEYSVAVKTGIAFTDFYKVIEKNTILKSRFSDLKVDLQKLIEPNEEVIDLVKNINHAINTMLANSQKLKSIIDKA